MITIRSYDIDKYKFKEMILSVFDVGDLKHLHILKPELCTGELFNFANETKTFFHESFYKRLNSGWEEFVSTYLLFIENEIAPTIGEDKFVFQATPSFRVHLPNNMAVSLWHYDSDNDHKHPPGEINFQIPITSAFGTNAMWIESSPGEKDYAPIEMEYGEFAQFNGNKCSHGNRVNKTGITRVSFDFRILPFNKYNPNYEKTTGDIGRRFVVGDYYNLYELGK